MKYKMTFDYHTHTVFSHGKGTIAENVEAARSRGLKGIAITDHGPGHLTYGIKREAVPEMRRQIEELKLKYPDIDIFLGVEANIVNRKNHLDISPEEFGEYDFVIAGYHYGVTHGYCAYNWAYRHSGFKKRNLIVKNTDMTVKALYENNIKILTHPGDKGPFDMDELAKACAATDTLMEISTHHKNLTIEEIRIAAKYDVKFIISSDAHQPCRVGDFEGGLARAEAAGLDIARIVNLERTEEGDT